LWIYHLSLGSRDLQESADSPEKLSMEVQRLFNSHYLQNPPVSQNAPRPFYITGKGSLEPLAAILKKVLVDFEVSILTPLSSIESLAKSKDYSINQQAMSLSLGLGLTYMDIPEGLKINLIEGKLRKAKQTLALYWMKSGFFLFMVLFASFVLFFDLKLAGRLKEQTLLFKKSQDLVTTVLPQAKLLIEDRGKLSKEKDFFMSRMNLQGLYLKSLALISETKPSGVTIKEFDAEVKEKGLSAVISGVAANYEDINLFLGELKKKEGVSEVKMVASTFPVAEAEVKDIDFKLRFEIPVLKTEDTPGKKNEKRTE
jgi:hypothetical protein